MRLKYLIYLSFLLTLGLGGLFFYKLGTAPYARPTKKLSYSELKRQLQNKFQRQQALQFFDRHGSYLGSYPSKTSHIYVELSQIPDFFKSYVVSAEDDDFYRHRGFHWREIFFALWENIKVGRIKRGGSSITQQIAKNLFLDQKRHFTRKFYEIPWVKALEHDLSKDQLLELYLNLIHLGPGLYGVEAASRYYYQKPVLHLNKIQALYLTMIIPSPSRFNLRENPQYADFLIKKKNDLLQRLVLEKKISPAEQNSLMSQEFVFKNFNTRHSWLQKLFEQIAPLAEEKKYSYKSR